MKSFIHTMYPPITSYPSIANILSMKWHQKDELLPWLSDHFIQLIIRPNHQFTPGDYYDHADIDNYFCILFSCPWISWMRVNYESGYFTKFTDYIEYQIQQGYGIEACLDRFYFSFAKEYNNYHFIHSSFIYGFDSDKKEVYVSDFWEHGKYDSKVISYDEINRSMNNNGIINLFKLQDAKYKFNPELMKVYVNDYFHSRDSMRKFEFSNRDYNKGVIFGLEYYDYVVDVSLQKDNIDRRLFHTLYDHKVLMKYRLEYLGEMGNYDYGKISNLILRNNQLIEDSLILRNLSLKYSLTHSKDLLEQLRSRTVDLKQNDKEFVYEILCMCEG